MDKSSVFFSLHCNTRVKESVTNRLGVTSEVLQDTYLGMLIGVGRSPNSFKAILDRASKCMHGWSDRPMSRAGKETLLKDVI
jgi:hypothetical protein